MRFLFQLGVCRVKLVKGNLGILIHMVLVEGRLGRSVCAA